MKIRVQIALIAEIDMLIESYQRVKLYSVSVLKCSDRLKNVPQDGRIILLQEFVSSFRLVRDSLRKFIDSTVSIVSSLDLRRNGVDMLKYEILMTTEFLLGDGTSQNFADFRKLLNIMNMNIDLVMRKYQPASKMMIKTTAGFKEESCFDNAYFIVDDVHYNDLVLEHLSDSQHFRRTFLGKDHHTFIGTVEKFGAVIISLVREDEEESAKTHTEKSIYKIILRFRDQPERRETFYASQVKKSFLGRGPSLKQVLQLLDKDINFSKLKQVEADRHIEARLISLDEFKYRPRYKFGIMLCKPGQTTDNEYLSNLSGSEAYDRFLAILGSTVELAGFKGFAGGLDTAYGKTGSHFIYTKYKENEVAYHCSTMLPFKEADDQQIERKRHIGNGTHPLIVDIVNIIYLDGDMQFDPSTVKTQFTHVYIIIKQEMVGNLEGYRVALSNSNDVSKFSPPLPNPPVFTDMKRLGQFLLAKLVNAENASLKSPKFSKPNDRAHHALFDDILEEFCTASRKASKSSINDDPPLSPIGKMFSIGKKRSARQSVNGSLNELSTSATSPRFLKEIGVAVPKSPISQEVLNVGCSFSDLTDRRVKSAETDTIADNQPFLSVHDDI